MWWNVLRWKLYVLVAVCGCGCLQACTTTLNQFSVMGGGGEGGRRAVDNGWKGARIDTRSAPCILVFVV